MHFVVERSARRIRHFLLRPVIAIAPPQDSIQEIEDGGQRSDYSLEFDDDLDSPVPGQRGAPQDGESSAQSSIAVVGVESAKHLQRRAQEDGGRTPGGLASSTNDDDNDDGIPDLCSSSSFNLMARRSPMKRAWCCFVIPTLHKSLLHAVSGDYCSLDLPLSCSVNVVGKEVWFVVLHYVRLLLLESLVYVWRARNGETKLSRYLLSVFERCSTSEPISRGTARRRPGAAQRANTRDHQEHQQNPPPTRTPGGAPIATAEESTDVGSKAPRNEDRQHRERLLPVQVI